ncbi:ABC-three component system middle component 1 [Priestia megaterium]|uniref:ABC-three component system middle component 1 n=1 Tax=Priestia megaterium TaxID=1404 RepID=UPI00372D6920
MNIINRVHNELESLNFERILDINELNEIGFSLYTNNKINIAVKYYYHDCDFDLIKVESNKLREELFKLNYNIWNSYMFICIDNNEEDKDFVYLVEKDTKGLRKYVVQTIKDFDRIPFFNTQKIANEFTEINSANKINSAEVTTILEYIKTNQGTEKKLSLSEIDYIVNKMLNKVGD